MGITSEESETLVATLQRMNAETATFVAEQRKLSAAHDKLAAEANTFKRDYWLAPFIAVASVSAAIGALVSTYLAHH